LVARVFGTRNRKTVGQCAPLWSISLFFCAILASSTGLLALPVSNAQITTVTSLYSNAERTLTALLAEASRLPQTPERQQVMNGIAWHVSLLQTFEKADRLRAKFLGFPVTWSTVKTYLVTLATVALGLGSLLKGAGVVYTSQSVCPVA